MTLILWRENNMKTLYLFCIKNAQRLIFFRQRWVCSVGSVRSFLAIATRYTLWHGAREVNRDPADGEPGFALARGAALDTVPGPCLQR